MYSNNLICNILKYIDDNINYKITIEDLENKFFYNRYYIMKLFKKEMKITIIDYINSLRIYNCILQIRDTSSNLLYIAYKNGFYSIEYFSETFKNIIGVNPQTAKNYFRHKKSIPIGKVNLINNSFLKLYYLIKKKEDYLNNMKPNTSNISKLSIFKKNRLN